MENVSVNVVDGDRTLNLLIILHRNTPTPNHQANIISPKFTR